jgi:SHS2 domain-containing protein
MPFEELAHTADWAMRVRAANLPELFAESARGMNALSGARPLSVVEGTGPRTHRTVNLSAPDAESLLVAFLSELVYAAEQENLVFTSFHVDLLAGPDSWNLKAEMDGAPIASINKFIKAVTYHNLKIREVEGGVDVEIVFDV